MPTRHSTNSSTPFRNKGNQRFSTDIKGGIVYKIPTDSIIVRRWIEYYHLNVGDAVMIEYKGDISKDCTVNGIVSMTEAIITGEGAIVEE